jgi:hypothetical protein
LINLNDDEEIIYISGGGMWIMDGLSKNTKTIHFKMIKNPVYT